MNSEKLGLSGRIARQFQDTEITPLLALIALLMGLFAIVMTPREEEPQIDVTFANIFIAYPGASAGEVERLISTPAEQIISEISGIEHVYSVSRPGLSTLTAQFEVGEQRTAAIVRLYNKIYSNSDWLPTQLGVSQPIIKPKGIDDVPIVSLTLWTADENRGAHELQKVAHAIETELKRVPGTRDIYTIGGPDNVVRIQLDPQRLAGYDIDLEELKQALLAANSSAETGVVIKNDQASSVQAGVFLTTVEEISSLIVGVKNGSPVYLRDVAVVLAGADQATRYVWFGTGPAAMTKDIEVQGEFPAVTLAIAKQPGMNAVDIANAVIARFDDLKGVFVPEGIEVTVTRNYGQTADEKAQTLIKKLVFVTIAVVFLVLLALGWREAIIVGVAVIITLMLMLFASWAWGFTLNRVSLFALIFSIGILVDDAIVVVENIHRHYQMGGKSLREAIPLAVDEVGGPTILATFAVIAALLPMAFVTGLMGPYMSPIPINASIGMLLSLLVAYILTPWMVLKMLSQQRQSHSHGNEAIQKNSTVYRFFYQLIGLFILNRNGRKHRWLLLLAMSVLIAFSVGMVGLKLVVLKMLPFDNKSEFQVVVDMPEGTSLERTSGLLRELGSHLAIVPEVTDYQAYAGTASPINFNGLVRQYYLREGSEVADIQVNLSDKKLRDRQSHEVASATREPLQKIAQRWGGNVKIVEVPPGPPVQSPIVAEVYGLDYGSQLKVAKQVRSIFEQADSVVDIDDSVETHAARKILKIDREKAALLGVSQAQVVSAVRMALAGEDVGYLHEVTVKYAVPLRLEFPVSQQRDLSSVLKLRIRNLTGALIAIGDVVEVIDSQHEQTIFHKDLLPVSFVTANMAGDLDSPLYGMLDIIKQLQGTPIEQFYIDAPILPVNDSIKWDGEWQVTYETFRDMGLAYVVGIILIYLLVVAHFRSYLVPLVIMAPIPLTIIGVMPGHALLGTQFTATSMIGMIAMAGIIVRNSILLVEFINQAVASGVRLEEAVIQAAAVRAKPIVLTAIAAMLGALFILDDPIFNGLAVALLFGIMVSTALTLLVIPVMYYALMRTRLS
ncbi:MAG: efflux RND transporter permease subunit [Gammaproteobacteria bacterium]|nr:efflux RND transporter permease subunit [Gammaproteobacteria bacterium]